MLLPQLWRPLWQKSCAAPSAQYPQLNSQVFGGHDVPLDASGLAQKVGLVEHANATVLRC